MMLNMKRIARHWLATRWHFRRAFPRTAVAAIEHEIQASESMHAGEIRFVVEGALSGLPLYFDQSARERAIDVFAQLRMWDTEYRNGVLIYLLLADRSVEIVADRGVHAKTGEQEWKRICDDMEDAFRSGRYRQGAVDGVRAVTHLMAKHFPSSGEDRNELPDKIVLL